MALVTVYLHGSTPAYLIDELCQVADVKARQRLRSSLSYCLPSVTELFRSALLASEISQGSAATEFSCGGRFYATVFRSLSTNPKVNELLKSVHICQSYRNNKSGTFFMAHGIVHPSSFAHLSHWQRLAGLD